MALQSVAWTTMLVERSQHASLTSALKTTFDGQHPCEICQLVKSAKSAERRSEHTFQQVKLEAMPVTGVIFRPVVLETEVERGTLVSVVASRSEVPPLPPPRTV